MFNVQIIDVLLALKSRMVESCNPNEYSLDIYQNYYSNRYSISGLATIMNAIKMFTIGLTIGLRTDIVWGSGYSI